MRFIATDAHVKGCDGNCGYVGAVGPGAYWPRCFRADVERKGIRRRSVLATLSAASLVISGVCLVLKFPSDNSFVVAILAVVGTVGTAGFWQYYLGPKLESF